MRLQIREYGVWTREASSRSVMFEPGTHTHLPYPRVDVARGETFAEADMNSLLDRSAELIANRLPAVLPLDELTRRLRRRGGVVSAPLLRGELERIAGMTVVDPWIGANRTINDEAASSEDGATEQKPRPGSPIVLLGMGEARRQEASLEARALDRSLRSVGVRGDDASPTEQARWLRQYREVESSTSRLTRLAAAREGEAASPPPPLLRLSS